MFVIQRIVPTSKYAPAQIDREIAAFRRQHHCLDERAQPFERLRSQRPVLKGRGDLFDLLGIDATEVGEQ
ncbi:hypothetical protein ASE82_15090 [Sphingomonas sp. Leaf230]|nr:hypothetical protein ASE82_15090 [Sphingomonas sp. Leaf230]